MENLQKKNVQKKSWKKYLAYAVGIFILLAAIGSCNSSENTEELNLHISELQKENEELTKQLEEIQKKNEELEVQTEEKQKQIAAIKAEKETANEESEALKTENESLQTRIAELEAQVKQAESQAQIVSQNTAEKQNSSNDEAILAQNNDSDSSQDVHSYTVYVTKTGGKYHRSGCRYLSQSQIAIEKDEAIAQGYGACSVCNP